jgi:hypothetical protein
MEQRVLKSYEELALACPDYILMLPVCFLGAKNIELLLKHYIG